MLVEEFMENFVTQFEAVETALDEARAELNSVDLPPGIGPLRLSLEEVGNIVIHAGGFTPRDDDDMTESERFSQEIVMEGVDELTEQLYLAQYPNTLTEVVADFHKDIVAILVHNPDMMGTLSGIVRHLKTRPEHETRLSTSRKFEQLLQVTETAAAAILDDAPDYALRILDEVADFSHCMTLTSDTTGKARPEADNDNSVSP